MAISNDEELSKAVEYVNRQLQDIQNYLGRKSVATPKIRFPRGYLRNASDFRSRLSFIKDENLKKNISYTLILIDVLNWLINRTDIYGSAKEMVIKNTLVLLASISESFCVVATKGMVGKKKSFKIRTNIMLENNIIDVSLKEELQWLWNIRDGIHFYELDHMEHGKYKMNDYNKAILAVRNLVYMLNENTK